MNKSALSFLSESLFSKKSKSSGPNEEKAFSFVEFVYFLLATYATEDDKARVEKTPAN